MLYVYVSMRVYYYIIMDRTSMDRRLYRYFFSIPAKQIEAS